MTMALQNHVITILLLGTLSAAVFFFQLGSPRLDSWDEAIYAQVAKEMVSSGDWITPHWNQQEFFQKPPLLIWLTALLFKVFGISEFTCPGGVGSFRNRSRALNLPPGTQIFW